MSFRRGCYRLWTVLTGLYFVYVAALAAEMVMLGRMELLLLAILFWPPFIVLWLGRALLWAFRGFVSDPSIDQGILDVRGLRVVSDLPRDDGSKAFRL